MESEDLLQKEIATNSQNALLGDDVIVEQKESIKLVKNTKGYNWEIKLIDKNDIQNQIDRLDQINKKLISKFN